MTVSRRTATIGGLSLLAGTSMSTMARAEFGEGLDIGEGLEDFMLAQDAYIYGYPLVTMEMTRRVATNVASVETTRAPIGQIVRIRQYPDASFRDVTAPNADTLYTAASVTTVDKPSVEAFYWVESLHCDKCQRGQLQTFVSDAPHTRSRSSRSRSCRVAAHDMEIAQCPM
jgi:hypothetical protein